MGPSPQGRGEQWGGGRLGQGGSRGTFPRFLRGPRSGQAAGQPSHLHRRATERRSKETAQWVADHARPDRRYLPRGGAGLRHRQLRRVKKSLASRRYQLLSGHAAIGSFLHERMTGPGWSRAPAGGTAAEEAVVSSPLFRAPSVGPPDRRAVEEGRSVGGSAIGQGQF